MAIEQTFSIRAIGKKSLELRDISGTYFSVNLDDYEEPMEFIKYFLQKGYSITKLETSIKAFERSSQISYYIYFKPIWHKHMLLELFYTTDYSSVRLSNTALKDWGVVIYLREMDEVANLLERLYKKYKDQYKNYIDNNLRVDWIED